MTLWTAVQAFFLSAENFLLVGNIFAFKSRGRMSRLETAINTLGIRHALVCPNNLCQSPETFGIQCSLDDGNHPGTRTQT